MRVATAHPRWAVAMSCTHCSQTATSPQRVPKASSTQWNTPFFGRDILAPTNQPPRALMVYNKRNYGILEGSDFMVLSEAKPSAFRISNKFRLEPAELTPHRVRIVNEGLGTLHAAERLLLERTYRDAD